MLTLLHGDNLAASYSYLLRLKKEFQGEIIDVESKNLTEKLVNEIIGQDSLFTTAKLIVVTGQPLAAVLKNIQLLSSGNEIIIWVDKKIGTSSYKAKILEFKDSSPNPNFKLSDCFANRDLKGCLKELANLGKVKTPSELIIGILARQVRLLLQLKDEDPSGINPYVVSKLRPLLGKWENSELKTGLEKLLELDHKIKAGKMDPGTGLFNYIVETV